MSSSGPSKAPGGEAHQVRRYACNRCRGQKLRCERAREAGSGVGNDNDACRRCIKARAQCVTSPPMRMGRPKHSRNTSVSVPSPTSTDTDAAAAAAAAVAAAAANTASVVASGAVDATVLPTLASPFSVEQQQADAAFDLGLLFDANSAVASPMQAVFTLPDATVDPSNIPVTERLAGPAYHSPEYPLGPHFFSGVDQTALHNPTVPVSLPPFSHYQDQHHIQNFQHPSYSHSPELSYNAHEPVMQMEVEQQLQHQQMQNSQPQGAYPQPRQRSSSSVETREDCLEKLSNLSSSLVRQLSRMNDGSPQYLLSNLSSPTSIPSSNYFPTGTNTPAMSSSSTSQFPVGEILRSAQNFLGILKHILTSTSSHQTIADPLADDSDSDSDMEEPCSPEQVLVASRRVHPIDFPVAIAIFTCYVLLIRIYRTIYMRLLDSAQVAASTSASTSASASVSACTNDEGSSPNDLPAIFPGVHLDGFDLSRHRSLQVIVLTNVSMDLLGRIERIVVALAGGKPCENNSAKGKGNTDEANHSWAISGEYTHLLSNVIQQNAQLDRAAGDIGENAFSIDTGIEILRHGGVASLKTVVDKIHKELSQNMGMQLEEAEIG